MLLMQHIDGGRQLPPNDDRQIDHRAAAERPDLFMIRKNLGDVGDGVGDKELVLFVHDFEPAVIMDRLGARDRIVGGMAAVGVARRATSLVKSTVITVKSLKPATAPVRFCKAFQHSSG